MLASAFTEHEESSRLETERGYVVDRLSGSDALRRAIDERRKTDDPVAVVDDVLTEWEANRAEFSETRERHLRY